MVCKNLPKEVVEVGTIITFTGKLYLHRYMDRNDSGKYGLNLGKGTSVDGHRGWRRQIGPEGLCPCSTTL